MKTPIKRILTASVFAISVVLCFSYLSCNRDQCKTIVCSNGGVCNLGSCICPVGYEGSNCETVTRTKFLGNWEVFEKGSVTNAAQYGITIAPSEGITDVVIQNFYNYFRTNINAYVSNDTIYIPNQQYEGKLLFGIGTIYNSTTYGQYGSISMEYEIIDTATQLVNDFGFNSIQDGSNPSQWNK